MERLWEMLEAHCCPLQVKERLAVRQSADFAERAL
jgi:hypothetical protein